MADYEQSYTPPPFGDRPVPQSVDAERAVLSCLLQDPDGTIDVILAQLKADECFSYPPHRKVLACVREMRTKMIPSRIDLITLSDALERQNTLEDIGGAEYLNALFGHAPTTANLERYIGSVLDSFILRSLINSCNMIVGKCYDFPDDVPELIDEVEQEVLGITEIKTHSAVHEIKKLIPEAVSYIDNLNKKDPSAMGIQTGFGGLDRIITGMRPGDMIVLAARPSIGKTTLAMNIARNVAVEQEAPVGVFSLEMGATQVVVRLLCAEASIDPKDVRDGRLDNTQWKGELMPAADRLYKAPLYIDDTPAITSLELRQKARRMYQDYGVKLLVIDYLQLMKPAGGNKNSNREQDVARMSNDIKALAKELKLPIIILCQLNRQAEQTGARPKLSHLRESGAIEQDADMVMLMHRERETDSGLTPEQVRAGIESEIIVAKNRNGETGVAKMLFFPHYTRFESPTRFDDEDVSSDI